VNILGIIPARAGSKRISGKNRKMLGDKPLIMWTIEQAVKARSLSHLIVTTDDPEIIAMVDRSNVEIHKRASKLATDEALSTDVIAAVLKHTSHEKHAFCLLQPTSPFRLAEDIDHCCDLFRYSHRPIVSVSAADRDQPNGAVYVSFSEWLIESRKEGIIYPFDLPETLQFPMPELRSLDIDTPQDWTTAEHIAGMIIREREDARSL
jgi:CMP-N-acetylneuraminic acid synthetase